MQEVRLQGWREWYLFARKHFGYEPTEATEYANRRYAEELNRNAARERSEHDSGSQPAAGKPGCEQVD